MTARGIQKLSQRILAAMAGLSALAIGIFGATGEIVPWVIQLFGIVVSAGLAAALTLHIYGRQLGDRIEHRRSVLRAYCEYLMEAIPISIDHVLPDSEGRHMVSAGLVNPALLTDIILESDLTKILPDLVRLDQHVHNYFEMGRTLVMRAHDLGEELNEAQAMNVLRAGQRVVSIAEKILFLLDHYEGTNQDIQDLSREYVSLVDEVLYHLSQREEIEGKVADVPWLVERVAHRGISENDMVVALERLAILRLVVPLARDGGFWFKITSDGKVLAESVTPMPSKMSR